MQRRLSRRAACTVALALACLAGAHGVRAGTIEELQKRQRNGLWETSLRNERGRPLSFCVTDRLKVGAVEQTRQAMRQFGCRTDRDVVSGDRFEVRLACSSPDPVVGTFRMTLKGEMRSDYVRSAGTITGGGPLVQAIAQSPDLANVEWRWKRPCLPSEKPGLQGA